MRPSWLPEVGVVGPEGQSPQAFRLPDDHVGNQQAPPQWPGGNEMSTPFEVPGDDHTVLADDHGQHAGEQ